MLMYDAEVRGKSLLLRFGRPPGEGITDLLKEYGYKYYFTAKVWVGTRRQADVMAAVEAWNDEYNRRSLKVSGETLCWSCDKSGFGNCSYCPWEAEFKPVGGWVAIRQDVKLFEYGGKQHYTESYLVLECPLYKRMRRKR